MTWAALQGSHLGIPVLVCIHAQRYPSIQRQIYRNLILLTIDLLSLKKRRLYSISDRLKFTSHLNMSASATSSKVLVRVCLKNILIMPSISVWMNRSVKYRRGVGLHKTISPLFHSVTTQMQTRQCEGARYMAQSIILAEWCLMLIADNVNLTAMCSLACSRHFSHAWEYSYICVLCQGCSSLYSVTVITAVTGVIYSHIPLTKPASLTNTLGI